MGKFWKYTLINIGIIYGITLILAIINDFEVFLIAPLLLAILEFFIALFFVISDKTRTFGQSMAAASGIVFLIGLGVCSMFPIKI